MKRKTTTERVLSFASSSGYRFVGIAPEIIIDQWLTLYRKLRIVGNDDLLQGMRQTVEEFARDGLSLRPDSAQLFLEDLLREEMLEDASDRPIPILFAEWGDTVELLSRLPPILNMKRKRQPEQVFLFKLEPNGEDGCTIGYVLDDPFQESEGLPHQGWLYQDPRIKSDPEMRDALRCLWYWLQDKAVV